MTHLPQKVLIVGHDESLSRIVSEKMDGDHVVRCDTEEAEASLREEGWDFVLCSFEHASQEGWAFAAKCRGEFLVPMIVSGPPDNAQALEAYESGAEEYLAMPFSAADLLCVLRKRQAKLSYVRRQLSDSLGQDGASKVIVHSECMKRIFETVGRLAQFSTTVLISGESGTGKELVAREIHYSSPRHSRPFVAINCGAIPENLMESELFGHKKGAFTDASRDKKGLFEEADGGTMFLDEIGELPLHLQVKLLRALQEQQIRRVGDEQVLSIDVRVIAATLRNLEEDVKTGRFRDDLFYRLNVVSIDIPPLRDRREEIPILLQHFMKKHNKRLGLKIRRVTPEALEMMMIYRWRGNVRELENCVERSMVLTENDEIDLESLPDHIKIGNPDSAIKTSGMSFTDDNLSIKQKTRDLEVNLISRALQKTKGNRTHAAKILEISHRALLYKLKEYGLSGS